MAKSTVTAKSVKRVVSYSRVSPNDKPKQGEGNGYTSIDAQEDRTRAFIANQTEHEWRYVESYIDDQKSGKDLERPHMRRLLADARARKFDVVVVYKIDRFSRSIADFITVMREFEQLGITFVSVSQNLQTDTVVGRLTLHILMSFAEFEREMIVERTRDKIASTRAQGRFSGGLPPYGYDAIEGELIANESEAETLRAMFAHYLETRSIRDVSAKLNADAIATKKRGKHARAWTPHMVARVLRCAVPTGVITHGDQVYEGKHTAILDRELFDRAQAMLAANTIEAERKGRNHDYVLQSVIRCACVARNGRVCDSAMCPGTSGNRKGSFRYYRCSGREKGRDGCTARALPADAIESFVFDRLREIAASGTVATQLTAHARELVSEHRAPLAAQAERTRVKVIELAETSARLSEQMVKAKGAARATLAKRAGALQATLAGHEQALTDAERKIAAIDAARDESTWLAEQLKDFAAVWDLLTPEYRGRLIRGLVRTVDVDESKHAIAIVFAPLDETRRALLPADADSADRFVSVVKGELHRSRPGKGIAFARQAPPARVRSDRPAKVARLLAVAHNVDRAIASGACPDLATMAKQLKMTRARITQVVGLTFLAPDIQETILTMRAIDGREPLRERALRPIAMLPTWERQREAWAPLIAGKRAHAERAPVDRHRRGKRP